MAQLLFSEIGITDLRGRISGTQFTRVRSGNQGTRVTTPRQANSEFQQVSQNQFQQVIAYWKELPDATRIEWEAAAELTEWARINKVGEEYQPSGQSLFIQLNLSAFKQSFPIASPPTYPTFTELAIDFLTAQVGGDVMVYFSNTVIDQYEIVLLYTTQQLSQGRMSVNQREYFFTDNFDNESFFGEQDIRAQYESRWGTLIAGQKIFVRGELLHYPSGARLDLGWKMAVIDPA